MGPTIKKKHTRLRKALDLDFKLAITLRYLATFDSYKSLMYGIRVAGDTICVFVREVHEDIIAEYAEEEWRRIAKEFGTTWQFHHAVGALELVVHFDVL